jgi:hypothetical protein
MNSRQTKYTSIRLFVKRDKYKTDILWKDLIKVEGVCPNDKITHLGWVEEKVTGFGGGYDIDNEEIEYIFYITVTRSRLETDEEFAGRMQDEENRRKGQEEQERLEYLRLRAKYETSN